MLQGPRGLRGLQGPMGSVGDRVSVFAAGPHTSLYTHGISTYIFVKMFYLISSSSVCLQGFPGFRGKPGIAGIIGKTVSLSMLFVRYV